MKEELKFEKAIEKLEVVVSDLEGGEMPLEEAIKKYEDGVKLSRLCLEKLNQAERKVEILTKALSGEVAKEDFVMDEDQDTGALKKTRKKKETARKKPVESEEEETLF